MHHPFSILGSVALKFSIVKKTVFYFTHSSSISVLYLNSQIRKKKGKKILDQVSVIFTGFCAFIFRFLFLPSITVQYSTVDRICTVVGIQ